MILDRREYELLSSALTRYADLEKADGNYITTRLLLQLRDLVERTLTLRGAA